MTYRAYRPTAARRKGCKYSNLSTLPTHFAILHLCR
jgi:hypothetical protein